MQSNIEPITSTPITVLDAPCGAGKTSWILQHIRQSKENFIVITPFLTEVERVKKSCPRKKFVEPQAKNGKSKSEDLLQLISEQRNIVSTHALFELMDADTASLIKASGYTLVLDEVLSVLRSLDIKPKHTIPMFTKGALKLAPEPENQTENVFKILPGRDTGSEWEGFKVKAEGKDIPVETIQDYARRERLYRVGDHLIMWIFPAELFKAFSEIYCLSYLFEGSQMKVYFEINGMPYDLKGVTRDHFKRYAVTEHSSKLDVDFREQAKDLINIWKDDSLNAFASDKNSLSFNYWSYGQKAKNRIVKRMLTRFFKTSGRGKIRADKAMWTCFEKNRSGLIGNGYRKGFVSHNCRATNDHHKKRDLAYLVNRFIKPGILQYCKAFGYNVDGNLWAVSEAIQWIYRSRVRDQKTINLWIPSRRMRGLLIDWLYGSLEAEITVEKYEG